MGAHRRAVRPHPPNDRAGRTKSKRARLDCPPNDEAVAPPRRASSASSSISSSGSAASCVDANEPVVPRHADRSRAAEIAARTFERPDGTMAPYLTEDELHYLRIRRGTLDAAERAEVESHVEETYRFLTDIPWTDDLKNLAAYAYGHHEKLDGTGYPAATARRRHPDSDAHHDDRRHVRRAHRIRSAVQIRRVSGGGAWHPASRRPRRGCSTRISCDCWWRRKRIAKSSMRIGTNSKRRRPQRFSR